jgi:hypothetical protein
MNQRPPRADKCRVMPASETEILSRIKGSSKISEPGQCLTKVPDQISKSQNPDSAKQKIVIVNLKKNAITCIS